MILKSIFANFLTGLIFWFPIWIIGFVLNMVFGSFESLGKRFLSFFIPDEAIFPGIGIILGLFIFFATGLLLRKTNVGNVFSRMPIVGIFFRKTGGETFTLERLSQLTPCLFLLSPTCPSYGWILLEQKVRMNGEKAKYTLINVYYPNVPSILTGQIYPVRKEAVIRLGNKSREVLDLLFYTIRNPPELILVPWEDETEEEFKVKSEKFGLGA